MVRENKKKIKFNFIDVIILVIVILALILGYKLVIGKSTKTVENNTTPITFTIEGKEVAKEICDKIIVGSKAFNSATGEYLGVIKDVTYNNSTKIEYNPVKDVIEKYNLEDKYNVYVTVEADAVETEKDLIVNGETIKVGKQLYFKSKGFAAESYIVDVDIVDSANTEQ